MIKIYTIYDTVADVYSQPFYLKNHEIAKREIKSLINEQQPNLFNTNTSDKVLYCIGEFDENNAIIVAYEKKERVIHLNDLKENKKDE